VPLFPLKLTSGPPSNTLCLYSPPREAESPPNQELDPFTAKQRDRQTTTTIAQRDHRLQKAALCTLRSRCGLKAESNAEADALLLIFLRLNNRRVNVYAAENRPQQAGVNKELVFQADPIVLWDPTRAT